MNSFLCSRIRSTLVLFTGLLAFAVPAIALARGAAHGGRKVPDFGAWVDYPRRPAFEVNVLWPVFPGGMTDLKVLVPVLRPDRGNWRGELIAGLHSDFGWRFVRDEKQYGRVAFLAAKLGYRQFFAWGLHLDVTVNAGWRHEEDNPRSEATIHAFQGRLWTMAGYQHEFSRRFYANLRGGVGIHLWRTDPLGHTERLLVPAGDLNVGLRF